jgi:hypothetical protein
MRRLGIPVLLVGACLVLSAPALGKGPIQATIDGPGLGSQLQIGSWDNWGDDDALAPHQPVMQFSEAAGFFAAAFGGDVARTLSRKPNGALGPRYVVEYGVPGPDNDRFRIVQDLYPYAEPDPVTFMPPGQPLFETDGTRGGWFVATPALMDVLVDAGLPAGAPGSGSTASDSRWTIVGPLLVLGALFVAWGLVVAVTRRRPQHA